MYRTTIELRQEQRAALVALAAERGIRGFSLLIQAAVDDYLALQGARAGARRAALKLRGSLADREGKLFAARVSQARGSWER